jgi:hypothetical protein
VETPLPSKTVPSDAPRRVSCTSPQVLALAHSSKKRVTKWWFPLKSVWFQVSEYVRNATNVLVMLGSSIDSREVKHHLNAYHGFVSEGSYCIVQDTFHGNAEIATRAFLSERKVRSGPAPLTLGGKRTILRDMRLPPVRDTGVMDLRPAPRVSVGEQEPPRVAQETAAA